MERIHLDPNARAGNISKRSSIKSGQDIRQSI